MKTYVGSFAIKTTTGQQTVTGIGFKPKAIIFWGDSNTTDANHGSDARQYRGVAVSPISRFCVAYNQDSLFGAQGRHTNAACITMIDSNPSVLMEADIVALDTGGFTINVSTTNGTAYIVNYIALGGVDLTNTALKQFQAPVATGSQATTGVGFQSDAIILFTEGSTSAPPANFSEGHHSLGFGINSTARGTNAIAPNRNQELTNKVLTVINSSGTVTAQADLNSLDSDGFTLNWGTTLNTMYAWALCLKGGSYATGSATSPTSTGNKSTTGIGFRPTGLLVTSNAKAAGGTVTTPEQGSFGAASDSSHRANQSTTDDNSTNQGSELIRTRVLKNFTVGGAIQQSADLVSFDADGYTLNYDTVNAVAFEHLYFAIGNAATGSMGFSLNKLRPRAFTPGIAR